MDHKLQLDRWLVRLGNLRDMGDGEALRFYIGRTKRKFPIWSQSHTSAFQKFEQAAAMLEAVDQRHGRGAALNLRHRTVIQSLRVKGHRYTMGMAENARRYAILHFP